MNNFLTLKEYDDISKKLLTMNSLKIDNHNIAFINEMMMKADMKYDENKTSGTRRKFRSFYAIYGIRKLKSKAHNINQKKKKGDFVHLLEDLPKMNTLASYFDNFVFIQKEFGSKVVSRDLLDKIKKSNMTDVEKTVCEHIMFNFFKKVDIANEMNISKSHLNEIIKGIRKKDTWLLDLLG